MEFNDFMIHSADLDQGRNNASNRAADSSCIPGQHVRIRVHRQRDRRVPEHLLYDLRMLAVDEAERRGRVPVSRIGLEEPRASLRD